MIFTCYSLFTYLQVADLLKLGLVMSSKKGSKNGFMKFCFSQQKNDSSLSGLSIDQLVARCSPRWESLPASQKSHFQQ